jgi:4-hydroxy-3-methylbut-2-enyl diphosphate reductase
MILEQYLQALQQKNKISDWISKNMSPASQPPAVGKLFKASRMGFCNGVREALKCVEQLLENPPPGKVICVYNEIVHNNFVVKSLKERGIRFVRQLDEVPANGVIVWSAHGVSPRLQAEAARRNLIAVDATCPLVKRLHELATEYSQQGAAVIFIGHKNHPETEGVLGCGRVYCVSAVEDCSKLPEFPATQKLILLTQTTWCADDIAVITAELQKRYPQIRTVSGICYATGERQQAVRELIVDKKIELLLVTGSPSSSNTRRLCEVSERMGVHAVLIDDPAELLALDLEKYKRIGLTAGASAPGILIDRAVEILQSRHNLILDEE